MSDSSESVSSVSSTTKKTFFSHVFSTTEEGKAEILNVVQYSVLGVIPVVILNKLIQRFIPDADPDKSSLEILAEILIQIIVMFCGVILIHRVITFVPTYSEFKYESLSLTNVILAFLVLVLSIQTKLGIKVNILFDRVMDLWNGTSGGGDNKKENIRKNVRVNMANSKHSPSQGDYLGQMQNTMFPPAPLSTSTSSSSGVEYDHQMRSGAPSESFLPSGPMPANGLLGGVFGSSF